MSLEKYSVELSAVAWNQLKQLIPSGQRTARIINRDRILLKVGEGWSTPLLAAALYTPGGNDYPPRGGPAIILI